MRPEHNSLAVTVALILALQTKAADLKIGYSDGLACEYRDNFHVPTPLRKQGDRFEWGALAFGTPVRLRVQETASTASAKAGDRIDLEVIENVFVQGFPVIQKGAEAWATIEPASKSAGGRTEWLLYNPHVPPARFGQNRAFPMLRPTDGQLSFQVQGAYDITGGQVALYATDVIEAENRPPGWELDSGTALIWQALLYPIGKIAGAKMPPIIGHQAVLRQGTEIQARVDGGVCYDLAFLRRVQEQAQPRPTLERSHSK